MRFRIKSAASWRGLFACVAEGVKRHPGRVLRHIWILNPFVRKTVNIFSLRVHGDDFVRDFFEASRDADIKPFLMWGTLLGYVRERALLKHDTDIDVGILAADWPKREALIEAMRKRGYEVHFNRDYKIRFARSDRITHIDIDVLFAWEGKMVCLALRDDGSFKGAWFAPNLFDKFRSCDFLNADVFVPDPPEPVLEAIYGDWQKPLKSHNNRIIPNRLELPYPKYPVLPT